MPFINNDYYNLIFKRKSFHIFKDIQTISDEELNDINDFFKLLKPLDDSIRYEIKIVPEKETTCRRGAQYCIELYSEEKGNYLRNIGYIGEQIDLYLVSKNIGTLWFGIGKPDEKELDGLKYVIMIAIAKVDESSFRKDMFKSKRKELNEIWEGDLLPCSNIVRFAPSACNTQPWIVENNNSELTIYRYKKPGKRGIMPIDKVKFYNRIDIGIFLFFLEVCLEHNGYSFDKNLYLEDENNDDEKTIIAKYKIVK